MNRTIVLAFLVLCVSPTASAQDGKPVAEKDGVKSAAQDSSSETEESAVPREEKRAEDDTQASTEAVTEEASAKGDKQDEPADNRAMHSESKKTQDDDGAGMPHGARWNDGVYGSSGWWTSLRAGVGLGLLQVNEGIAATGSQMAPSFSVGSMLHASHRWGFTLDVAYAAVSLREDQLNSGWSEYTASNLLVTFGGKVYPWVHEVCSMAIAAHVGVNQYNSSVVGESGEGSWGGPELVVGGAVEFSYFPIHALEVSVNVRADQLLGGENKAELEWKGTGAPSSSRLSIGAAVQLGFHF